MTAPQCTSEYAECPEGDRRCIQPLSVPHTKGSQLHYNRAGFAWDDQEAAESTTREVERLRECLADLAYDCEGMPAEHATPEMFAATVTRIRRILAGERP